MMITKRLIKILLLYFDSIGFGECHRCSLPWNMVNGHCTIYHKSYGCFPLCEKCWGELTPKERLPYYKKMYNEWGDPKEDWEEIKTAVLKGL